MKDEPKREPRSFVVALSKPLGRKDGRKEGSFVAETRRQATEFYGDLVQGLVPPRTKAPKIREDGSSEPEDPPQVQPTEKPESMVRREHETNLQRLAEIAPFTSG
jgi:hypothetical protein